MNFYNTTFVLQYHRWPDGTYINNSYYINVNYYYTKKIYQIEQAENYIKQRMIKS